MARIPGFHPGGSGSIPGTGIIFFYLESCYSEIFLFTPCVLDRAASSLQNLVGHVTFHIRFVSLRRKYSECLFHAREVNPLKPELNPICYLLALLGAHHFLHVSRIRVKLLTFRLLMSCSIYGASILDVSRSHTTTQHSR